MYKQKSGALHQYIRHVEDRPDIIAIQETGSTPSQPGYSTHTTSSPNSRIATLVARYLTVVQHTIDGSDIDHILIEILPTKRGQPSLFVLNLYSPPSRKKEDFDYLFATTLKLVKRNAVVILGDFNAPHPAWGYGKATTKGNKLWELIHQQGLTLYTDPNYPTRIGNSITRDTCPDLTMTKNLSRAEWHNSEETLGSDHCILVTTVPLTCKNHPVKKTRLVNWDAFRKQRENNPSSEITNIEEWVRDLHEDVSSQSKELTLSEEKPAFDPHLLHLCQARRSMLRRWRRQKLNRRLKIRIAKITEEAAKYAAELMRQNWNELCNKLQGTLGSAKTWALLRNFLDPTKSRSATQNTIKKIMHQHPGTNQDILDALRDKYIGQQQPSDKPEEYRGDPNEDLDRPITLSEVKQAVQALTNNTTPGADKVTNRILRNLDDTSIQALTTYFNHHWEEGTLPREWTHADIVLIPKPGKPPKLENLRPISLTSCIGKLFEHVVLNRLQPYIENNNFLPPTMFGFRPHLSTQDILLQLHEEITQHISPYSTKAILALDLKAAFDNVSHKTILRNLSDINCGQRTFAYISAFLRNRTATVGIGDLRTPPLPTPNKGTPQGAVLSPTLFNIAMMKLPAQLAAIEGVHHAIYADDVTIWANIGSDGEIQEALQRAADIVQQYARNSGLECAPEKSELLLMKKKCGKIPYDPPQISLTLDNQDIPQVQTIRILGLYLQQDGGGSHALQRLKHSTNQVIRIMSRIANRRHGLKEEDTTRLVQALVISRVTYTVPYITINRRQQEQLESLVRQAYKRALNLPPTTSTQKLLALGVHNTVEEHVAAHLVSQRERLQLTPTGRQVLERLGYPTQTAGHNHTMTLPHMYRDKIHVRPIPKNMHPDYNQGRREARARALQIKFQKSKDVRYTDAASYPGRPAMVISVIDEDMRERTTATVSTPRPLEAEETAIALAITSALRTKHLTVVSDSQAACRSFSKGRISKIAHQILTKHSPSQLPTTSVIWTPGHSALGGNERAHASARAMIIRAPPPQDDQSTVPVPIPLTYHDILQHQRLSRRSLPPPHKHLTKEETVEWRLLQTNTYPHLSLLHSMYPAVHPSNQCPLCGRETATLYHVTWACPETKTVPVNDNPTSEQWEAVLSSSTLEDQRRLVERARATAKATGALE